ncbi:MAG: hypothetical protein P1U40_05745 [Coxiellaceae bacterium]|nr:hypothetical protein [Coxiellaceae bacterium]
MRTFCTSAAVIGSLLTSSINADPTPLLKTTLIITLNNFSKDFASKANKIATDLQAPQLNVGRIIFVVAKPSDAQNAKTIIQLLPKNTAIQFYLQPYPDPTAWKTDTPANCPALQNNCLKGSSNNWSGFCDTVAYSYKMKAELSGNYYNNFVGLAYDRESIPINKDPICISQAKAVIKNNPSNITEPFKFAIYISSGGQTLSIDQADLSLIEFYDFAKKGLNKYLQCSYDTISPQAYTISKDYKACVDSPTPVFPGPVFFNNSFSFVGSNIYSCALNPAPVTINVPGMGNKTVNCSSFNQQIKSSSPSDRMISAYDYLINPYSKSPTNYPTYQTTSPQTAASNCTNTVVVFSTQYIGQLGAISNSANEFKCINYLTNKPSISPGFDEACGTENGFGVWLSKSWPKNSTSTPLASFQKVANNITKKVISSSSCPKAAPVGIYTYEYIPQDWLNSSSTPAAQKTNTTDANTGASTKK